MKVIKSFKVQPYAGWVTVVITDNVREVADKTASGCKDNWDATTYFGKTGNSKIILPVKQDAGIIAHESIHAILNLFDNIGIIVSHNHDEPFTYQVQWLIYKINDMYDRMNKDAVAKKTPAKA